MAYFFKPDCLRILFNVPKRQIVARFTRDGNPAGLGVMLNLAMTTLRCHQVPAILAQHSQYVCYLHNRSLRRWQHRCLTYRLSDAGVRRR